MRRDKIRTEVVYVVRTREPVPRYFVCTTIDGPPRFSSEARRADLFYAKRDALDQARMLRRSVLKPPGLSYEVVKIRLTEARDA